MKKKTRILVVDDEAEICDLLKNFLVLRDYDVFTAGTISEALASVEKDRPHLIFLDIRLKEGSGLDVLHKVKEAHPGIKVVMLTALEDDATIRQAKTLGADDYIAKPFTVDFLQKVILQKLSQLSMREKRE